MLVKALPLFLKTLFMSYFIVILYVSQVQWGSMRRRSCWGILNGCIQVRAVLAPGGHAGAGAGPDHLQRSLPTSAFLGFCCTNTATLWNPAALHVGDAMDCCSLGLKPALLPLLLQKWVNQQYLEPRGETRQTDLCPMNSSWTWWPKSNVIHRGRNNALIVQCSISKLMFDVYLQFSELIFKIHNLDERSRKKQLGVFFFFF